MSASIFVKTLTYDTYRVVAQRAPGTVPEPDPLGAVLVGDYPDLETACAAAQADGNASVWHWGKMRARFVDGAEQHTRPRYQFATSIAGLDVKPAFRRPSRKRKKKP